MKKFALSGLAVVSMICAPVARANQNWLECAFNGKSMGQPSAYLYVDLKNSNENSVNVSYRNASGVDEEPRKLEASGFASNDSIFVVSVEKIFMIELKRSLAVNRRTNNAELLVSSRTPNLTDWGKPVRYKGTCVLVSQTTKATQLFNQQLKVELKLTGDPIQAELLTTKSTITHPGVMGKLSYSWQRSANGSTDWETIKSQSNTTYTLSAEDVGFFVRSLATYTDSKDNKETVYSAPTPTRVLGILNKEKKEYEVKEVPPAYGSEKKDPKREESVESKPQSIEIQKTKPEAEAAKVK